MMNTRTPNSEFRIVAHRIGALLAAGLVMVLVVFWTAGPDRKGYSFVPGPIVETAYAEDDEDEDEDEDEEDDDGQQGEATETRYVTHYEVRQVPRTVIVIPTEYRTDSDGDQLVDALDPDPDTHQREYFTDDDGDIVPNVFDRHPGEDDFAYFDSMYDTNDDGIIDAFEGLAQE